VNNGKNKLETVRCLYQDNTKVKLIEWKEIDSITNEGYLERFSCPVVEVNAWKYRPLPNIGWYRYYYEQFNTPYKYRYEYFKLPKNIDGGARLYDMFGSKPYRVIHNATSELRYELEINNYSDLANVYITPEWTSNLLDWTPLLLNAQEIHVTHSSVYNLVDSLDKQITAKKYFHDVRLTNAPIEYEDLVAQNWQIVRYW
jgi:hypothetical protein